MGLGVCMCVIVCACVCVCPRVCVCVYLCKILAPLPFLFGSYLSKFSLLCYSIYRKNHLETVEAEHMAAPHVMWNDWRLIAFSTLCVQSINNFGTCNILLLPPRH